MKPIKHLIECRCILPQFRNNPTPIFHKFSVLSFIDDNDDIISKLEACNNCGVVHKVYNVCKSTILTDNITAIVTIDDIKLSLPEKLVVIFESNDVEDKADWELAKFIIENKLWGQKIILSREFIDDQVFVKTIKIIGETLYDVETITTNTII
jgi:hypothetical protein